MLTKNANKMAGDFSPAISNFYCIAFANFTNRSSLYL